MVLRNRHTSDLERKPTEHDHTVRAPVRPREAVTPAPNAGLPPSATTPDNPNLTDDNRAFLKELGTTDPEFAKGLLAGVLDSNMTAEGKYCPQVLFPLAVVKGIKPKDELESMHLIQMAVVHDVLMRHAGDFARAEHPESREMATRGINQLARTFTNQFEAFKRHHDGGEKHFTIQNVSVAEGGQAIVGNVTQATPDHEVAPTTPPLTDARQAEMEIMSEPERMPVRLRRAKSRT